jgi:hypothetical protein
MRKPPTVVIDLLLFRVTRQHAGVEDQEERLFFARSRRPDVFVDEALGV